MDLDSVEEELKKNWCHGYRWHGKQDDDRDALTSFVFDTKTYDDLTTEIDRRLSTCERYQRLADYAHNRWYNVWSARAVEEIFKASDRVVPTLSKYDRFVDFSIDGTSFDHKTSVFPRGFGYSLDYAVENPRSLIEWLYLGQSQQKRWHLRNRLFIVVHAHDGQHWRLKAEIRWMRELIEDYLRRFNADKVYRFKFAEQYVTLSDIIWGIR